MMGFYNQAIIFFGLFILIAKLIFINIINNVISIDKHFLSRFFIYANKEVTIIVIIKLL